MPSKASPTSPQHMVWGYTLLLLTTLGWSGAWITARVAAHDAPPLSVTLGRYLVASVALVPVWWLFERRKVRRFNGADIAMLVVMSITGIVSYNILFMIGISMAPASVGAVITPGLTGVFSVLMASAVARLWPVRSSVIASILSLVGSLLVGWAAVRAAGGDSTQFFGIAFYVTSAASLGVYTVVGKRLSARVPPITGVLVASTMGVILLVPIVLWHDGVPHLGTWTQAAIINVVYLGLGATALALTTYYLAIQLIGIDRSAPALGLVPFFAVLGATQLLGEHLTMLHLTGGLLVIVGILLPAIGRAGTAPAPGSASDPAG